MGTRFYGTFNRDQILSYPTKPINVLCIVLAVDANLAAGVACDVGGFIIFDGETVCTDAVARNVTENYQEYFGEGEDPVGEVWSNVSTGSFQYKRDATAACNLSGTVLDSNGVGLADVPMYFSDPANGAEAYVRTDSNGNFSATQLPVSLSDSYFFGAVVGPRRNAYPEYMGNADYHLWCDGDQAFNQTIQLQLVDDATTIAGTLAEPLRFDDEGDEGWRLEIHAVVSTSAGVGGGGWINDSVSPVGEHPYTSFNPSTGEFSVTALAGDQEYTLTYAFEDSMQDEFRTEAFTVPAGSTTNVQINEDGSIVVTVE